VFIVIYALIFTRNILNTYFTNDAPQQLQTDAGGSAKDMYSVKDIMAYASILENNPFGPPLEFKPLDGVKITSRPQASRSELVLYGTVTGPESLSYAIISDKSRPSRARQDLFAHGDEVFVYGTLTKIQNDSVEITQDGNSFTVYLFDINKLQSKSNTRTAAPGSMVRKINEKQYLLDQRKVQQALNNPEQVLSDARLYPNINNGNHEGFKILEVKRGGIYEELGLRNRDVLLRINGLDLASPEAAMQAMTALKGMKTVNLDIIRSGSKMTLNYQIR
jgi:general secretion pathway protein C